MGKYILEQSGSYNWMAIFALITFFVVFIVAIFMLLRKNDPLMKHMQSLPLEDDETIIN
ncbi:MAG: hypothetical protein R2774_02690 [Saprospiraceae bacterium]